MFLNNCISRLVQIMVGTLHVLAQGHRPEHSVEDQDDCQDQELSELVDLGPVPEDLLPVCLVVDPGIFGVLSASEPGPVVGRKQMADEELVLVLLDAVLHASGEKKKKRGIYCGAFNNKNMWRIPHTFRNQCSEHQTDQVIII